MKRGGPLQRKPPLRSESPLRPNASGTDEPKQARPRRSTGKHVGEGKAKRLMKKRSGGVCETQIPYVGCLYFVSDFHHRQLQGQGGEWEIRNGLGVCRPCHLALTNTNGRRKEYERYGWLVPSHGNPAAVEVYMVHDERRDWFLLMPDGSVQLAPWPKGDPRHPDDIEVRVDRGLDGVA